MTGRGLRRVALVGAGHAHLHLLRHAEVLRGAGVEPVLVSPPRFHYSGLISGVLSGVLEATQAEVDVAALATRFGVRHLPTQATGVDLQDRRLHLETGEALSFDQVSLNVGSVTRDPSGLTGQADVWAVKPLARLFDLKARVEEILATSRRSPVLVVAGGGPSGFEIATALAGLVERHGLAPDIRLVVRGVPGWAPDGAIARLTQTLRRRGVTVVSGEVVGRSPSACSLAGGKSLPCDMLVLASGLEAPGLMRTLGLPVSEAGRLRVSPTLQSIADPAVFAVGDCSLLDQAARPMAGVFGVRAAPVLLRNLAAGDGGRLRAYRPQSRWLSIMDLGDGTGLAKRGSLWGMGRWALWLKRRLDLGFIARVRAAPPVRRTA